MQCTILFLKKQFQQVVIQLNSVMSVEFLHIANLQISRCLENAPSSLPLRNLLLYSVYICTYVLLPVSDMDVLDKNPIQAMVHFTKGDTKKWENMIKCPEVQELINSETEFHLIISELFLGSDIFFALGKKFGAPIISTTSQCLLSYHNWILGNPIPFSLPDSFMKVTDTSLSTRALNLGFQLFSSENSFY